MAICCVFLEHGTSHYISAFLHNLLIFFIDGTTATMLLMYMDDVTGLPSRQPNEGRFLYSSLSGDRYEESLCEYKPSICGVLRCLMLPFTAFLPLVGPQEKHPPCRSPAPFQKFFANQVQK